MTTFPTTQVPSPQYSILKHALAELLPPRAETDPHCYELFDNIWRRVRRSVLSSHPWSCCMGTCRCISEPAKAWLWEHAFGLPKECLRVVAVQRDELTQNVKRFPWVVVNDQLLTNEPGPLYVSFVLDELDVWKYDPLLFEAMVARTAYQLAYPLTQDADQAMHFWQLYQEKLREARAYQNALRVQSFDVPPTVWASPSTLTALSDEVEKENE